MGQQQTRPKVHSMWLKEGKVYVEFTDSLQRFQVCRLDAKESCAMVDGAAVTFDTPPDLDLSEYYIVSKFKKENGQNHGQKKGSDEWQPVKLKTPKVPYVECDGKSMFVIDETSRPWTNMEKGLLVGACTLTASVTAVAAVPLVVAAAGFTATGITAGSTAASMMSAGIVGVPTLQSIGAAGMGAASMLLVGGSGAAVGGGAAKIGLAVTDAKQENGPEYFPVYPPSAKL